MSLRAPRPIQRLSPRLLAENPFPPCRALAIGVDALYVFIFPAIPACGGLEGRTPLPSFPRTTSRPADPVRSGAGNVFFLRKPALPYHLMPRAGRPDHTPCPLSRREQGEEACAPPLQGKKLFPGIACSTGRRALTAVNIAGHAPSASRKAQNFPPSSPFQPFHAHLCRPSLRPAVHRQRVPPPYRGTASDKNISSDAPHHLVVLLAVLFPTRRGQS